MPKVMMDKGLRGAMATLAGGAILLGSGLGAASGLFGCRQERPWATEDAPPMRLVPGEARQTARLGPEDEEAIRAAALRIAGGESAWDGTPRLTASGSRWSDVPDAVAAAGARPDVQCVIGRVAADGSEGRWAFELMTAEREPGWLEVERMDADAADAADGHGGPRVTAVRLGRRPEAMAMQRRADRLVAAFHEELERIGASKRFAEVQTP